MSSISGMITSLKNNKRTRVSAFDKIKNFKEGKNIKVSFNSKATPQQLRRIKEKLQNENKKKFRKNIIILSIALIIIIYAIGFVKF